MLWLAPQEALDQHQAGSLAMMPPTAFTLAELTGYPSVDSVLEAANGRDIRPVLPRVVVTGEQAQLLLPGDADYAARESDGDGIESGSDGVSGQHP